MVKFELAFEIVVFLRDINLELNLAYEGIGYKSTLTEQNQDEIYKHLIRKSKKELLVLYGIMKKRFENFYNELG